MLTASALPTARAELINVELVVFAQQGGDPDFPEINEPELRIVPGLPASRNTTAAAEPDDVIVLSQVDRLRDAAEQLGRQAQYRLITVASWQQNLSSRATAPRVELTDRDGGASALSGSVRVYETRSPVLDLALRYRPRAYAPTETVLTPYPYTRELIEQEWALDERRRVGLDEVHYFDHPFFGVLAVVWQAPSSQ